MYTKEFSSKLRKIKSLKRALAFVKLLLICMSLRKRNSLGCIYQTIKIESSIKKLGN